MGLGFFVLIKYISKTDYSMKERILNLDGIEKEYSFIYEDRVADRYFCNCGEQFLSANEEEVVDHVLGLAGEALPQHRVLGRDADRAGVQMTLAHHDAAQGDQRRGRKTELFCTQQGGDGDITAGL